MNPHSRRPVVLCFSGHDPSGGAGLQADIEAIHSLGVHACTITTALTTQNTQGVKGFRCTDTKLVQEQAECLLQDIRPDAIKIGMVGSAEMANAIADILSSIPGIPVVLDPVLSGNTGGALSASGLIDTLLTELLPKCTLVTPNTLELERLSGYSGEKAIRQLLNTGCANVLVTGGHVAGPLIRSQLWTVNGLTHEFQQQRFEGEYHGSGCTLASACAAGLASGLNVLKATTRALDFTHHSIASAIHVGKGQYLPWR